MVRLEMEVRDLHNMLRSLDFLLSNAAFLSLVTADILDQIICVSVSPVHFRMLPASLASTH